MLVLILENIGIKPLTFYLIQTLPISLLKQLTGDIVGNIWILTICLFIVELLLYQGMD